MGRLVAAFFAIILVAFGLWLYSILANRDNGDAASWQQFQERVKSDPSGPVGLERDAKADLSAQIDDARKRVEGSPPEQRQEQNKALDEIVELHEQVENLKSNLSDENVQTLRDTAERLAAESRAREEKAKQDLEKVNQRLAAENDEKKIEELKKQKQALESQIETEKRIRRILAALLRIGALIALAYGNPKLAFVLWSAASQVEGGGQGDDGRQEIAPLKGRGAVPVPPIEQQPLDAEAQKAREHLQNAGYQLIPSDASGPYTFANSEEFLILLQQGVSIAKIKRSDVEQLGDLIPAKVKEVRLQKDFKAIIFETSTGEPKALYNRLPSTTWKLISDAEIPQ